MEFNEDAQLDTSQVDDVRGSGGGSYGGGSMGGMGGGSMGGGGMGLPRVGGGLGLVLMIGLVLFKMCAGGGSNLSTIQNPAGGQVQAAPGAVADDSTLKTKCVAGSINTNEDCRLLATTNSVQKFWEGYLPTKNYKYRGANTVLFRDGVSTGCGAASSAMGPFYCPADEKVYIDLAFYEEFRTKFGASGGPFAEAYVIAHEYGHHVQDILGTSDEVERAGQQSGPTSPSVRLELQADCYAGVWANHALESRYIKSITDGDITDGLDAAQKVGDDYIQGKFQGKVSKESWTHGSSAQRQKWFKQGMSTGDMNRCDTFSGGI
jgi:uncharacterized protein